MEYYFEELNIELNPDNFTEHETITTIVSVYFDAYSHKSSGSCKSIIQSLSQKRSFKLQENVLLLVYDTFCN